ncbi:MAG: reverse transcriptase domain-containing protein [Candidatus Dojkabacteria bacterium]
MKTRVYRTNTPYSETSNGKLDFIILHPRGIENYTDRGKDLYSKFAYKDSVFYLNSILASSIKDASKITSNILTHTSLPEVKPNIQAIFKSNIYSALFDICDFYSPYFRLSKPSSILYAENNLVESKGKLGTSPLFFRVIASNEEVVKDPPEFCKDIIEKGKAQMAAGNYADGREMYKSLSKITPELLDNLEYHPRATENFNEFTEIIESFFTNGSIIPAERTDTEYDKAFFIYSDYLLFTYTFLKEYTRCIRGSGLLSERFLYSNSIMYKFKDSAEKALITSILSSSPNLFPIIGIILTTRELEKNKIPLYTKHTIRTKNKDRVIYAPQEELKRSQRNFLQYWLNYVYLKRASDLSYAFTKKKECLSAVYKHRHNKYVMVMDLAHYFDTINRTLVTKKLAFILSHLPSEAQDIFLRTVMNPETGGIYQGSPLSGIIANYASKRFIHMLKGNLNKGTEQKYEVTIYADDITISSTKPINKKYVYASTLHVLDVLRLPFEINYKKTKLFSNQRRYILGYRINNENRVVKSLQYRDKINFRVLIHKIATGRVDPNIILTERLVGQFNEVFRPERSNPDSTAPLRRYVEKFSNNDNYMNVRKILESKGVKVQ